MVAQMDKATFKARPSKAWARIVAYTLFEGRPLTTKGRWINPFVFAGYKLWGRLPCDRLVKKPIFVVGIGRSGTTLLGKILGLHPDVGFLNEPKALWHAALGNDDLLGSYSDTPGRYKMDSGDASPALTLRLKRYYGAFLLLSGCRRVVDKYPEMLFRTELLKTVFPDAKKIVIVRNGLDTCQSIDKWSRRKGKSGQASTIDWWGKDTRKWRQLVDELVVSDPAFSNYLTQIRALDRHIDRAAVEWVVTMRRALKLMEENHKNLLFVHYEDLVAAPRVTLTKILRFCDLNMDHTLLSYAEKSVSAPPAHSAPRLNPAIQGIFDETMSQLGYRSRDQAA